MSTNNREYLAPVENAMQDRRLVMARALSDRCLNDTVTSTANQPKHGHVVDMYFASGPESGTEASRGDRCLLRLCVQVRKNRRQFMLVTVTLSMLFWTKPSLHQLISFLM